MYVKSLPSADTLRYGWRSCSLHLVGSLKMGLLPTMATLSSASRAAAAPGARTGKGPVLLSSSLSSLGLAECSRRTE